ncbi:MAG: hypothetical protein KBE23_11915 [Chloroflexi bacterium]|nr:hypothetical protein [Chloroflexota bacterium]MBP7043442.1 hypothetical protein [Chloroflexota bacterium]
MNQQTSNAPKGTITPELVEQVTEKVYTMLLQDARLENERARRTGQRREKRP